MAQYPGLYVLRHGQTEWNVAKRYQGRKDSPLTALGMEQAEAQGRILKRELGARKLPCFTSPQLRAFRTAEIALAAIGQVAEPDDRLQEVGFGDWEGKTRAEIEAERAAQPLLSQSHRIYTSPTGESLPELLARGESFLATITAPSVIVSHGIMSSIIRGLWLRMEPAEMMDLPHGQGCVYHLRNGEEACLTE